MKEHIIDGAMLVTLSDGKPAARLFVGNQDETRVVFYEHAEFRERENKLTLIAVIEQDAYIANSTSYTLGSDEEKIPVPSNSGIYLAGDGSIAVLVGIDSYMETTP